MDNQNNNFLSDDEDICVTLDMEDGEQVECEILTIFELKGQDYIALLPVSEDDPETEEFDIYLYRYFEDEDGSPSLESILDDAEYEAVEEKFDELLDEAEFEEA